MNLSMMTSINRDLFKDYIDLFINENHKVNLISKNEEQFLWEKHICDSLALGIVFDKYKQPSTLLDFGTGGGFPSVPLAIAYPHIKITALDSIAKKIRAVQLFKDTLNLKNLYPICSRVEKYNNKFDIVTSRAVSSLKNIVEYGLPKLDNNGYFVAFKSKKTEQEIEDAKSTIKKFNAKIIDIIEYELPTDEHLERNLIIISKNN